MKLNQIEIPEDQIADFCRKWNLSELSLFGSILREDFSDQSDVDVLIAFGPGGQMTLESMMDMEDELSNMFAGRPIDLVERKLVRNPFRRHEILTTRKIFYAA